MSTLSFASILKDSDRARWSLDKVTSKLHAIDFQRPFLPPRMVHVRPNQIDPILDLALNQIRAHSYLQWFALIERFILPYAMLHAAKSLHGSHERLLALMQFGEEEAKHIALFERFSEAFEMGFGSHCEVAGPAEAVANMVLAEDPLTVGLLVLHFEWLTQAHYTSSVRGRDTIDPQFASLLRHHWQEEAQHARIDSILLDEMLQQCPDQRRDRVVRGYLELLERFDALLTDQVEIDLESLIRAVGSDLPGDREWLRADQLASYREQMLCSGLEHPRVRAIIAQRFPRARDAVTAAVGHWAAIVGVAAAS
jgi:hypothetical protein